MKTTLLVLPSLLLAIACGPLRAEGRAAEPAPDPIAARVDALFAQWAKPDSPGCAVGVVRGGKILLARGYGMADLEHDIPITPRTVFYIGSVGKQFTAYAVVRLAQQGKISLDDEVRKHVPELHDFGRPVTIRQLIHHTSGLRDFFELLSVSGMREGDLVTQKDLLGMIFKQRELNFPPGDRFLYSNSNYALLATIVERVTGEPFRDWMAANVFAPPGMNQTRVCDDHQRIILVASCSRCELRRGTRSLRVPLLAVISAWKFGPRRKDRLGHFCVRVDSKFADGQVKELDRLVVFANVAD